MATRTKPVVLNAVDNTASLYPCLKLNNFAAHNLTDTATVTLTDITSVVNGTHITIALGTGTYTGVTTLVIGTTSYTIKDLSGTAASIPVDISCVEFLINGTDAILLNTKTNSYITSTYLPKSGGTISGSLSVTGNTTVSGTVTAAKVVGAYYNDYAEFFERGEETEAGDIIALDETAASEKYVKATEKSKVVIGVHSDSYSHIIGGDHVDTPEDFIPTNLPKYIPVALAGRVKVKFTGMAPIGTLVVPSSTPGVGRAYKDTDPTANVVGILVEPSETAETKLVKIKVKG